MNVEGIKSGYRTTEFWQTAGILVFGLLVALGVIDPLEAEESKNAWSEAVVRVGAFLSSAGVVAVYSFGRAKVKAIGGFGAPR